MSAAKDAPDSDAVREAAVRLLARREHSRSELRGKLARKLGVEVEDVLDEVLDALADQGLQSDDRFAQSFCRLRAEKGYGPIRIRAELRQRGVGDAVVERAFEGLDVDFFELAAQVYARRYGRSGPPDDLRERARRHQAMQRRGFSIDHLREVDELSR